MSSNMNNNPMNNKKCQNFEFCVSRSMEYAKSGDYDQGISSFLSDVRKSECTKCIKKNFITLIILEGSKSNKEKFEEALRGFTYDCQCE